MYHNIQTTIVEISRYATFDHGTFGREMPLISLNLQCCGQAKIQGKKKKKRATVMEKDYVVEVISCRQLQRNVV